MSPSPSRTLPTWAILTAVQAVVLAAQWFPYTGVVLMMLAAPFWSVLLVNAILIAMAVEAVRGRTPRALLCIPVAAYGLYFGAVAAGRIAHAQEARELRRHNDAVRIAFDPTRHELVFHDEERAIETLEAYDLPVVFSRAKTGEQIAHRVFAGSGCQALGQRSTGPVRSRALSVRTQKGSRSGTFIDYTRCVVSVPEAPSRPTYAIRFQEAELIGWARAARRTTVDIVAPGSRSQLVAGESQLLTVVPLPVIGCSLDSSNTSWDCFAQFMRKGRALPGAVLWEEAPGLKLFAATLGLSARTPDRNTVRFDH